MTPIIDGTNIVQILDNKTLSSATQFKHIKSLHLFTFQLTHQIDLFYPGKFNTNNNIDNKIRRSLLLNK